MVKQMGTKKSVMVMLKDMGTRELLLLKRKKSLRNVMSMK